MAYTARQYQLTMAKLRLTEAETAIEHAIYELSKIEDSELHRSALAGYRNGVLAVIGEINAELGSVRIAPGLDPNPVATAPEA